MTSRGTTLRGTFVLRMWDNPQEGNATYIVEAGPQLYNWRLFLTPESNPDFWTYAWCFRDLPSIVLAVHVWNLDTEDEPLGWHKRPTYHLVRRAPSRDADAPVRCEHGTYPGNPCHYVGCAIMSSGGRIRTCDL